jgi:hypothetical protein
MQRNLTLSGVPRRLELDGWWLSSEAEPSLAPQSGPFEMPQGFVRQGWSGALAVLVLILLGDFLFWGFLPGINLALFAIAVFGIAVLRRGRKDNLVKPSILMVMSVLPVVEYVQLLSVCILLIGSIVALGWLSVSDHEDGGWVAAAAVKILKCLPYGGTWAAIVTLKKLRKSTTVRGRLEGLTSGSFVQNWAFPIGGACVLGALLISANPVLEQYLTGLFQLDLNGIATIERLLFWTGLGVMIWPLLNTPTPSAPMLVSLPTIESKLGLNEGSVLRALLIFNIFLVVQSGLDVSILLGGAELPDDMRYATYAHRGAYPLLVTAMLAGAFTFAARPFLNTHTWIKPLLLLWVFQNVLLTFSSALRLDLYIAEYGLTYLRIYALIWMALIVIGLIMVLWHVLRDRSSMELLRRLAILGFGTLYLCSFVNFASIIVTHTISNAANREHATLVDWRYLCHLGPAATTATSSSLAENPTVAVSRRLESCVENRAKRTNWREWDYRTLRNQSYVR